MKTSSLAFAIALLSTTVSSHGMAAVVYDPTAQISVSALATQGSSVAESHVNNFNGTESGRSVGPGGTASSTVSGSRLSTVSGTATIPGGFGGSSLTAASYGSASLERGELKASVVATGPDTFGTPGGDVKSTLADTVYFNNMSGGDLFLDVDYRFEGSFLSSSSNPRSSTGYSFLDMTNCGSCGNIRFAFDGSGIGDRIIAEFDREHVYRISSYIGEIPLSGSGRWFTSAFGDVGAVMATRLIIPSGISSLGVQATLNISCRGGDTCDFGHTGAFRFGALPGGLSYTSESGTFLTGLGGVVGGGVPEPATWAMMITGFGLIGMAMRRRRVLA